MPFYEYRCRKCKTRFELLTTIAKADKAKCSNCGSSDTERLLSVFGVGSSSSSKELPCAGGVCPSAARCAANGGGCPHLD